MKMQLTPSEIGVLATIIRDAIKQFPNDKITESDKYNTQMEEWEKFVEDSVNGSANLSFGYDILQKDHVDIYEYLVDYYSREI